MPNGRPSDYTDKIADTICEAMLDGETLVDICSPKNMPHRSTVYRWMDDNQTFATRCERARVGQAEFMDHKIMKEAKEATPENVQVAKVRISAYQWRAAKLNPKRYGDKIDVEHSADENLADALAKATARHMAGD